MVLAGLSLVGCASLSQNDRVALQRHHVSPPVYDKMLHGESLPIPDIVELSKSDLSSRFIIRYLNSTYAVYHLTSQQVVQLRHDGLKAEVLDYLLATPGLYGPRGIYGDPYFTDPYPYGYFPSVLVVGGYSHHGGHHHR